MKNLEICNFEVRVRQVLFKIRYVEPVEIFELSKYYYV